VHATAYTSPSHHSYNASKQSHYTFCWRSVGRLDDGHLSPYCVGKPPVRIVDDDEMVKVSFTTEVQRLFAFYFLKSTQSPLVCLTFKKAEDEATADDD
jgi:hypothetical protein